MESINNSICAPVCAFFFEHLFDICSFYSKFALDLNVINLKVLFKPKLKVVRNNLVHGLSAALLR